MSVRFAYCKPAVNVRQPHITDYGHELEQMKVLEDKSGNIIMHFG
jgi:hypothetical protein